MNQVEVKRIRVKSVFKVTLYLLALPLSIMIIVGVLATIVGISADRTEWVANFGPLIITPFFFIVFYGLLSMVIAAVYNLLSGKFGGLKIEVKSLQEHQE